MTGAAIAGLLTAQTLDQKIADAWMISRMVARYHVAPRPLDQGMSAAIYSQMLEALDEERLILSADDVRQLDPYRLSLDAEILNRRDGYLKLLIGLYQRGLGRADSIVNEVGAKPFDFSLHEILTSAEDSSWPAGRQALRTKIYKLLKYSVGRAVAVVLLDQPQLPAKSRDSLESILRKQAVSRMHRTIRRILQSPLGIDNIVGNNYCQSLAACYDPHTAYFPPDVKADFESRLGNKPLSFGLALAEDDNGNPEIGKLQAGGPAFQSGGLHEGDKIMSIRWDNKESIDVSGASAEEIDGILATEGGDRLTLSVKKADGTTREVSLERQSIAAAGDDDEKVKGVLLKGARTVGYISLPEFYSDWEDSRGINGCANDVAKEILRLKKENISGLILDLRYNGGGSVREAVELAGIFIDAGPVAQLRRRDAKPMTLKDVNRGTVYDGPLIVLVNGSSASASELLAGTLQDYHRALIVGSPTYGKATGQVVLPMDTTIDLSTYNGQGQASSYLKVTTSQVYRITGQSAQRSGVRPDVLLPEPPDAETQREADEKFALPATSVEPNRYYQPLPPLPVAAAQTLARQAMDSSAFFRAAREHAGAPRPGRRDISLSLADMLAEEKADAGQEQNSSDHPIHSTLFTIGGNVSDDRKEELGSDPYLGIAYRLFASFSN